MDKGRMHACMSPHPLQSGCRQRGSCPKADTLKAGSDKLVLKRCQGAASVFTEKGAGTQRSPPSPQSTEPLLQARPGAQRPSGPASPAGQGWRARPLAPGGWRPCRKREAGTVGCQPLTTLAACFGTSGAAQGGKLRRTPGGGHQGPRRRAAGHKCPPSSPAPIDTGLPAKWKHVSEGGQRRQKDDAAAWAEGSPWKRGV